MASWPTGRLLSAAARLVEQRWNARLEALGLSHAGLIALHTLRAGPLSQRELARQCQVTDQTMSRTLERLSRSGFVTRVPDPLDGRRSLASLTPAGVATLDEAEQIARDDTSVIGALGDDVAFRRQLIHLIGHLTEGS
ncbi:MarR family winged helix-turn-helix transcriptional regulator [Amycolatopsis thermophila]|uniref:DNA-binding MarR family transcriptional regulator n=1 Tax=Amycolatopsis thermophila TaxID=206084 RepID=A0ABU0ENH3_9PSEU|nr:MarR family transcriptional regulator [Amycolatopsis thermophila]MDQ0376843.1 DNA-binding MarR family transcriptional regulator [Amycolatopsis thermophila]